MVITESGKRGQEEEVLVVTLLGVMIRSARQSSQKEIETEKALFLEIFWSFYIFVEKLADFE